MTLRIPFHRTATVAVAALIGLAGAVASASPASAHTGELTATSECTATEWKASWTLTTAATGGHDGVLSNVVVEVDYPVPPPGRNYSPRLSRLTDGATVTGDTTVGDELTLSSAAAGATLSLTVTWTVGDDTHTTTLHARADAPTTCTWPPTPEPSRYSASSTCTTMTFSLVNPASNNQVVALRLTPSEGAERVVVAEPGETRNETFPAKAGFTIDVTSAGGPQPPGGARPQRLAYEQPENCSTGDGGAAGGSTGGGAGTGGGAATGGADEGGLPVTGAAAGTVAGIAAALLLIGGLLFAVARRRRTKFTA
ncbi:LPXTG cell wall anchor domain-containing protein [Nucisporomicrobium flavum]|uniref:LPXTG cell wall anchor domain-containing protein n=1 Tax=Nucisporomicrobium flavum TaxID=2785915 RepID=UPI0018F296BF|nr:LPXTG cell wall anchor domain-containing protein [Nucisporomicrobium flavum]